MCSQSQLCYIQVLLGFGLVFPHAGSSTAAQLGAGVFVGADVIIQNQGTYKLSTSFAVTSYLALKYQSGRRKLLGCRDVLQLVSQVKGVFGGIMLQCLAADIPLAPGVYGMWDMIPLEALLMSQREKCLFSHLVTAPPWRLQVAIFKVFLFLCQSWAGLPLSL